MQISTTLREGSPAAFSLDDVDLDGNSLGSFPGVHHGTENWQVNGYDLSSGFTFSGTLNLSGINSPSAELSKVDITLGYVNTDTFAPSVSNVSAVPNPQTGSSSVTLTATIDDTNSGGLNIKSAEYRLGAGTWIAMSAADGAFDSPVENVTAVFAAPEADGEHTLCVRGTDAEDNISSEQCSTLSVDSVGPISSAVLMVPNPADPSAQITLTAALNDSSTGNSNIASAEYQVSAGSWSPMAAQDGTFDSPVETVTVKFPAPASSGQVEVCVRGIDAAGNTGAGVCDQMQVNETAQTPVLYLPILSNIAAAP
jgi:hypothetical protein